MQQLKTYPLLSALLERRSRRFGKGMTLNGGPLAYQSMHRPQPLSQEEEAALAFAACGITGYALAELPYHTGHVLEAGGGNIMIRFIGRTVASGHALHYVIVFVMNDEGVWMLKRPQDFQVCRAVCERRFGAVPAIYAIADVYSAVRPGGALDVETWGRGQTVYLPDGNVPLHPVELSEGAASLLPDQVRAAVVWTIALDSAGAWLLGLSLAPLGATLALRWSEVGHGPYQTRFEVIAANVFVLVLAWLVAPVLADRFDARLMPTGMHPWLDPKRAAIWTRSNRRIYDTYARLFDIHTHGWANVQSCHVNLPLGTEDEAVAMMNAAAPSTGGEMIAPRPPADSRPPASSLL